jgi:hypothetical protein
VSLELWSWTFVWNFSSNSIWFIRNYNDKVFRAGLVWFIAGSIHRGSIQRGSINRESIHRKVNSSQRRFIVGWLISGSIHRRIYLLQGQFIAELCQLKTWLKREIFSLDIQNCVPGDDEKLYTTKWTLFHVQTKNYTFQSSKTSFTVAPSGDQGPSFVCPAKKLTYYCD